MLQKSGTTSLADYLRLHPALSGVKGPPLHPVLRKESHYYTGIFGRQHAGAQSAWLYKSCFGTVLERWWAEYIHGVQQWMCFDACPLPACLPYSAERMASITPDAKLIFMVRPMTHDTSIAAHILFILNPIFMLQFCAQCRCEIQWQECLAARSW